MNDSIHGQSDRDELAREIALNASAGNLSGTTAWALWAAGWRKKPSRETVARGVWKQRTGQDDESFDYLMARAERGAEGVPETIWAAADAILALMDGPTETGENDE